MTKQNILTALKEQLDRVEIIALRNPHSWQQGDRYANIAAAIELVEGMEWIPDNYDADNTN